MNLRRLSAWAVFVLAGPALAGTTTRPTTKPTTEPAPYHGHYVNPKLGPKTDNLQLIDSPVHPSNQVSGRQDAGKADWIALDRWHMVGPFVLPRDARNVGGERAKFPPEAKVDLDAVYKREDGRELKWQEVRAPRGAQGRAARIAPPAADMAGYSVYYFFADLQSENDVTVLASFAADDYGSCWINDELTFQSSADPQPWVPFTKHSFRVVTLKKGANRVLFRLENAGGTTGFSAIFMAYEDRNLIDMATK